MTFDEWYAGADELGFAPEIGTAAYLLLRDAWTVSARIERERCARVCAGLAESYQARDDTDSASALSAAAGLLRTRPGLDCCELTGPAKDIGLPRHEMPDRDGLWTYRHTDGALYYCTASESGDVLTWSRTPPQGDWGGTWECMEDDESGTNAGGES